MTEIKKVIRDGKVAVLYSPGYGAGWFSWNERFKECLFHPEVVELVEAERNGKIDEMFCEKLFGPEFYAGGARDLKIEWLPEGTAFQIHEYDGFESIETMDQRNLIA